MPRGGQVLLFLNGKTPPLFKQARPLPAGRWLPLGRSYHGHQLLCATATVHSQLPWVGVWDAASALPLRRWSSALSTAPPTVPRVGCLLRILRMLLAPSRRCSRHPRRQSLGHACGACVW
jgi:hypothetical protein